MKKSVIPILLSVLIFGGCTSNPVFPEKVKMDQLAVIQILGIDSTDDNKVCLTVLKRDIEDVESGAGGESSAAEGDAEKGGQGYIEASADTLAKAETGLQINTPKNLFFGHMDYCLIGESAASEGIYQFTDYIIRESAIPLNALLYVTKGDAKKLLARADKMGYFLPDYLKIFLNNKNISFSTTEKTVMDFYADSNNDQKISVVPLLSVTDEKEPQPVLSGYAVLKDFKRKIYLEGDEAKGYNILHNLYNNESIEIHDPDGKNAALTIDYMDTDIIPKMKNGKLDKIYVHCKVKSTVAEDHGKNDFGREEVTRNAEEQQAQIIEGYIRKLLTASQTSGCDVINLFKSVRIMNSKYYKEVRDDWENIYKNAKFEISVNSQIERGNDSRSGKGG